MPEETCHYNMRLFQIKQEESEENRLLPVIYLMRKAPQGNVGRTTFYPWELVPTGSYVIGIEALDGNGAIVAVGMSPSFHLPQCPKL